MRQRPHIGIVGLDWDRGVPLALAMRDYGYHSVIAHHPEGTAWQPPPEPDRETGQLLSDWAIPVTHQLGTLAGYCDLIFACTPALDELIALAAIPRPGPLPVILTHPTSQAQYNRWQRRLGPSIELGYSPIWYLGPGMIDRLVNPPGPIRVAGPPNVGQVAEVAWRHITNRVPVRIYQPDTGVLLINAAASQDPAVGSALVAETLADLTGHFDTPEPAGRQGDTDGV